MWDADEPVYAQSQGSCLFLGNGHVLRYHSATPKINEFDGTGQIVMRARFGYDNTMQTYLAYRYPWVGRPSTEPSVVACPTSKSGKTTVYVSLNGATKVRSWKVYSGFQVKKTATGNGIETTIFVDGMSNKDQFFVEAVGGVNDSARSDTVITGQGCYFNSAQQAFMLI
jgi:hypothetical protein